MRPQLRRLVEGRFDGSQWLRVRVRKTLSAGVPHRPARGHGLLPHS
jgi:hypothetical protein